MSAMQLLEFIQNEEEEAFEVEAVDREAPKKGTVVRSKNVIALAKKSETKEARN